MVTARYSTPSPGIATRRLGRDRLGPELSQGLRLAVLTHFFPPDYAATGQLIEELVRQLGQQQVNVSVFTGQPGYAFASDEAPNLETVGRVRVQRSRLAQLFPGRIRGKAINGVLFALRAILHLLRWGRHYQVLLVTTAPPFLPVIGYLGNLLFGLPYVCLLYDLYPDIAVELTVISHQHPVVKLWRWMNRLVWRRAAGIIVLSSSMQERVVAHCPEVESKIAVIHSWADAQQIVPRPKAKNWFAMRHHLIEPFVVLYSGNMGRCHDLDTIFEAALQLRDLPIKFVCVGGGAKRSPLAQAVKAASLDSFVFLPYQDKAVLPYSLTACDVSLVSVEQGMESLVAPSKLYPAMAAGRPLAVVCPPESYLGPLVKAAGCGDTFANGDAAGLAAFIRRLWEQRELAERLGRSGRRYMQANFTPERIAQQYLTVLEQAAQQSAVAHRDYANASYANASYANSPYANASSGASLPVTQPISEKLRTSR